MKIKINLKHFAIACIIVFLIFLYVFLTKIFQKPQVYEFKYGNLTLTFRNDPKLAKNIKVEDEYKLNETCRIFREFDFQKYYIVFSENDDLSSIAVESFEISLKVPYGLYFLHNKYVKFEGLKIKDFEDLKFDATNFYIILKSFKFANETIIKAKIPNVIEINGNSRESLDLAVIKTILCLLDIKIQ